ncbi:hypothetical protein BH24PSE2_BH24PSE2_14400 [soil metagenome]
MLRREKRLASVDTLIGTNTVVHGGIEFIGGLHVNGRIDGDVTARDDAAALLSVSGTGSVEGAVTEHHVILNGSVHGDVRASERVELGAKARISGNVYYHLIQMAIGAEINGKLVHAPPTPRGLLEKPRPGTGDTDADGGWEKA